MLPAQQPSQEEAQLKATIGDLTESAKNVVIMSQIDLSQATDLVAAIQKRRKEAEEARTKITKPINEGLREINARFKVLTAPLGEAEALVKGKMIKFQEQEEARARAAALEKQREEEARRAAEEKEAEDPTLDRAPAPSFSPSNEVEKREPVVKKTTYGQSGAAFTARKVWDFELEDLEKVPVDFVVLDSVKVRQAVRAGIRNIPGIRIFEKTEAQVK